MNDLQILFWIVVTAVILVVTCYAGSRAIAVAWFRTKLEFIRSVLKEGRKP